MRSYSVQLAWKCLLTKVKITKTQRTLKVIPRASYFTLSTSKWKNQTDSTTHRFGRASRLLYLVMRGPIRMSQIDIFKRSREKAGASLTHAASDNWTAIWASCNFLRGKILLEDICDHTFRKQRICPTLYSIVPLPLKGLGTNSFGQLSVGTVTATF